jgi:hypothetical protein
MGLLLATQVRVQAQANWPDYVFEEGYELRQLDELAGFIKSAKHLPGLPSAHELQAAQTVDLGEIQRLTLEKVEELTLYILSQHETIKSQQEMLNEQRALLKAQREELKRIKEQLR